MNIIQESLEVSYYFWGRYNLGHLSETSNPAKELVADCNIGADYEMSVIIGAIEDIGTCTEAIHNSIQKVVGKPKAHALLLTTEHSEMLLSIGFHIDLGEFQIALSWLVQNCHILHTIQTECDSAIPVRRMEAFINMPCLVHGLLLFA